MTNSKKDGMIMGRLDVLREQRSGIHCTKRCDRVGVDPIAVYETDTEV